MIRVLTYSVLLILGMVLSQLPRHPYLKPGIAALTTSFLAYIMIQVGWSSKSITLTCANMESFTLSQWPLAVLSTGPCKLQGGNSVILQSATYPYAAHLSKTNLFRSPAAGIRLALRVLQISQF